MNPNQIAGLVERLQFLASTLCGDGSHEDAETVRTAAHTITDLQAQLAEAVARAERAEALATLHNKQTEEGV